MDGERGFVDSRPVILAEKMRDKRYRDSYVAAHTRQVLARQMRNFRGELSQGEFGDVIGKRQTVVSRLENPNYGAWTLRTMFEVARKLNVAVFARFVNFPTFLRYTNDMTDEGLKPSAYNADEVDRSAAEMAWENVNAFPVKDYGLLWQRDNIEAPKAPRPGTSVEIVTNYDHQFGINMLGMGASLGGMGTLNPIGIGYLTIGAIDPEKAQLKRLVMQQGEAIKVLQSELEEARREKPARFAFTGALSVLTPQITPWSAQTEESIR